MQPHAAAEQPYPAPDAHPAPPPHDADAADAAEETACACVPATEEELRVANGFKAEGNELYGKGEYEEAIHKYSEALAAAPDTSVERAVFLANMAACYLKLEQYQEAANNCTAALELDKNYMKALMRRSLAYEQLDDLEHALADAEAVAKLDPGNTSMDRTVKRLTPIVAERREKLKDEMLGKLKDLGNTVLGKFGMSLDNFKATKDPSTGSYSINFQQ